MTRHQLTDVRGIGPKTADSLMARGIDSVAALAAAPVEMLSKLPGFFASRSHAVKAAAAELLGPSGAEGDASTATAERAQSTSASTPKKTASGKKKKAAKKAGSKKPTKAEGGKKKKKKKAEKKAQRAKAKKKSSKADGSKSKPKKKKKKKKT
jgi:hypothetical protein